MASFEFAIRDRERGNDTNQSVVYRSAVVHQDRINLYLRVQQDALIHLPMLQPNRYSKIHESIFVLERKRQLPAEQSERANDNHDGESSDRVRRMAGTCHATGAYRDVHTGHSD